jgi:hypothetical protein
LQFGLPRVDLHGAPGGGGGAPPAQRAGATASLEGRLPGKYLLISSSRIATPIRISLWTTTTSPRQRESAALSRPPVLDQIKFVQVATSPQQVCNSRNIHRPCGVF